MLREREKALEEKGSILKRFATFFMLSFVVK